MISICKGTRLFTDIESNAAILIVCGMVVSGLMLVALFHTDRK